MEITERDLRTMVRQVIARRAGHEPPTELAPAVLKHASHAKFVFVIDGDPDGRCVIEPAVACTHCGYCQSLGH
jgi:hypothetical protein